MALGAAQDAFVQALLDPRLPPPQGVTTARGERDAARFAVYRNNVFVGLTKALGARFPVTERLVGADFFAGMARVYAQDRKPASPLMFEYGDDFADFVAGFSPAASVPYLADIARLEAAWTRAYHAPDEAPLEVATLAAVAPANLLSLRFRPHASACLIASRFPIGSIWAAHQTALVQPVVGHAAQTVLVTRPDMEVGVHVLPQCDKEFSAALVAGSTLGGAAEVAMGARPDFDFGAALVGLLSLGAFAAI